MVSGGCPAWNDFFLDCSPGFHRDPDRFCHNSSSQRCLSSAFWSQSRAPQASEAAHRHSIMAGWSGYLFCLPEQDLASAVRGRKQWRIWRSSQEPRGKLETVSFVSCDILLIIFKSLIFSNLNCLLIKIYSQQVNTEFKEAVFSCFAPCQWNPLQRTWKLYISSHWLNLSCWCWTYTYIIISNHPSHQSKIQHVIWFI